MTGNVYAARASLHKWEEPCLSGSDESRGAGTVFFTGCNMGCVYCQNFVISNCETKGKEVTVNRLTDIFFELEQKGAYNIDLVTPTHFMPTIKAAIEKAKNRGISVPFVYNTGGYEKTECIKELDGLIDIYLPDFKYFDNDISGKYSGVQDYFQCASEALDEMVRQCRVPEFDESGEIMKKGVIVRHLVLPGNVGDSKNVVKYIYETYGDSVFISIMNQYTPVRKIPDYPQLNRKLTKEEYDSVVDYAIEIGVENGFVQEGDTTEESFIPLFECEGI